MCCYEQVWNYFLMFFLLLRVATQTPTLPHVKARRRVEENNYMKISKVIQPSTYATLDVLPLSHVLVTKSISRQCWF